MKLPIVSLLLTAWAVHVTTPAVSASPDTWGCRNTDMEITCDQGVCSAASRGDFTPMSVTVTPQALSVCAYSGCWDGKAATLSDGALVYTYSASMKWSGTDKKSLETFQLSFNQTTGQAVLLGAGYAQPLHCKAAEH